MIQIKNLVKEYGDFRLAVSMEVPAGRVTGLVGRNGAGKSTTIKAILGLVKPDSGSVSVLGKEARNLSAKDKERIGVALAESGFSAYLTAEAIIKILKNLYADFDEAFFRRQMKEQGLPLQKQIKEYSTGMKAKLRVLTAMSHRAELLILDEPTAGLDVVARNEVLDMLRDYMAEDENRSILITSHISSDLEGLCDDIYMIHNGQVVLHEETDVLLSSYGILKVTEAQYASMDKRGVLGEKKTSYGYECLTGDKHFYLENYPDLVIEKGQIDELIVLLAAD